MPGLDTERIDYFVEAVERDLDRVKDRVARLEATSGTSMLKLDLRALRDHARILANFGGVTHLPEMTDDHMRAVLRWVGERLIKEGETTAGALVMDEAEDVQYDARVEFCGEEPRGAGADPYGRPSPQEDPGAWTE